MRGSRRSLITRTTAGLAVAGLASGLALAGPTAAHAARSDRSEPARDASAWLISQLDGNLLTSEYPPQGEWPGYTAKLYGPTLDGVISLRAMSTAPAVRTAMLDAVADEVDQYVSGGDPTETYVGALGKLATTALIERRDIGTFAGGDLLSRLQARVTTEKGPQRGRVTDQSKYGDYSSTYSQAWSVRALSRGKVRYRQLAARFLLKQQCGAGFFREQMVAPDGSSRYDCAAGRRHGLSAPDVDATALGIMALRDARAAGMRGLGDDIRDALGWLSRVQQRNGSFVGNDVPNANSTGLAAWVLRTAGRARPAAKATAWLQRRQVQADKVAGTALEGEAGAVAYNHAAYLRAREDGITQGAVRSEWLVAASQAIPGLVPPR